ncbi:fimbria/pilus outer membrane usher protein [Bradyrhizobium sp. LTSPM299]|uniref:fimbria/pilus outer membrane usher protein n=1 Tax=Bradyrhizobium sp. LTSPM299 TaxID=1619233 RepID=UPI000678B3D5|nr:fimbria/pilus outer membrane usher protein [Bradyrhizobium sp. LTSPM299]
MVAVVGAVVSSSPSRADEERKNLQLDVVINGASIKMIASFVVLDQNRIGATPQELKEIGLRLSGSHNPDEIVPLDDIPTVSYDYLERTQTIRITVDNRYRIGQTFDLSGAPAASLVRTQAAWGSVLNYDLLSSSSDVRSFYASNGNSLTLDGRVFSPYGTFQQSAIVRSGPGRPTDFVRLDTSFRYSDQQRMITYVAGDTINGGLAWSRPVRIGGFQAQSNFLLRPDLVTMPLPSLGGSAAVPSTVDVYVNNMKTFTQEVAAGPFSVNNVPLISGSGSAELVIRDAAGHETRSTSPFYASSNLLAPELTAWSVEAGLPRLSYGSDTDVYVNSPIGSATLRRGIFDWMTLEGHVEAASGLANGGAGAVIRTGAFGVAGAALSASTGNGNSGLQTYFFYETRLFGLSISASSQHTFGSYEDLASTTARLSIYTLNPLQNYSGFFNYLSPSYFAALPASSTAAANAAIYTSARPPLALDRITFSPPLPLDEKTNVSASFIHLLDCSGTLSNIATATVTRSLPFNASAFATIFRDFGTTKNTGVFAGLTIPIGPQASVSTGVSRGPGGITGSVDAVQSLGPEPGSYGWRVREADGAMTDRLAAVSYRSNYGMIQAGVSQTNSGTSAALELRGSITSMGGDVFLSNWVDDGFAVVNVGVPGVTVLHENRPAGVTDSQGMLLVPTLRAYQTNKIEVDPVNLPVDAEIESTHEVVTPADRAGTLVKFQVRSDRSSALVTFVRPDGRFVPAGARGRIDGGNEFIVGYDGQAFIRDLGDTNRASIETPDGSCGAEFPFTARPGEQVQIASVVCR